MRMQDIDLRWVFVIVVVVLLLLSGGSLFRGPLGDVLALIAGSYLCTIGWERLRGSVSPARTTKSTYWRGQRIELRQERRMSAPPWYVLVPGGYYLVLGAAIIIYAVLNIVGVRF